MGPDEVNEGQGVRILEIALAVRGTHHFKKGNRGEVKAQAPARPCDIV
jgi:hypothetical protein